MRIANITDIEPNEVALIGSNYYKFYSRVMVEIDDVINVPLLTLQSIKQPSITIRYTLLGLVTKLYTKKEMRNILHG